MTGTRDTLTRLRESARALAFGNPIYNLTLGGHAPDSLLVVPPDPWPGDGALGSALLGGVFRLGGQALRVFHGNGPGSGVPGSSAKAPPAIWLPSGAGPGWIAAVHGFAWLRDLRVLGGDAARRQARQLVTNWLDQFGSWHTVTWEPEILGTRIAAWIGQHDFYCASADDAFRARVFDSLARQTRHLARVLPGPLQGAALLSALKGLAFGGLCLPEGERILADALRRIERELPRQVLPDGGHVERSPSRHLQVLRDLIDLRAALRIAKVEVPEALQHAIDRMTPALRFFRHGDGGLALFNGSQEEEAVLVDTALAQADARGRPLRSAPHTGFERLLAGRSLVLMDTGRPVAEGIDDRAHAGTLGFEMSVGRERLIVNCGAHPSRVGAWRAALAATAAHSTVTVAETNSTEVLEEGGLGRRPDRVVCERGESDGATLVEASHDGYYRLFGLIHRRRLFLSDNGEDLRGEDALEGAGGHPFTVRFHLHPTVQVALVQNGTAALLRLPSGVDWRLRASGGTLDIAESIYFGTGGEPRRSSQITIAGQTVRGAVAVKWGLRREKKGA